MVKKFKLKLFFQLHLNKYKLSLDNFKKVGVGDSLLSLYTYEHSWDTYNLHLMAEKLGIPFEQLTNEVIPSVKKHGIGSFSVNEHQTTFFPSLNYKDILFNLRHYLGGRKIFFIPEVAKRFTYKDAFNLGVLLGLALESNLKEEKGVYEFKLDPVFYNDFYPNFQGMTQTIMKLHNVGYDFIELVCYQTNPNDVYVSLNLKDLKKFLKNF